MVAYYARRRIQRLLCVAVPHSHQACAVIVLHQLFPQASSASPSRAVKPSRMWDHDDAALLEEVGAQGSCHYHRHRSHHHHHHHHHHHQHQHHLLFAGGAAWAERATTLT